MRRGVGASRATHVYLAILEPLLQVLVDGLIGDFADQRQVRDTDFLLLGRLKDGLCCELRLWLRSCGGLGTSGLARCAVGFPLHKQPVSAHAPAVRSFWEILPWLMPDLQQRFGA